MNAGYSIWTKDFWKAAAERAVRVFAWATGAALGGGALNMAEVPWLSAVQMGGMAALLSLLASLAVNQVTGDGPALTRSETVVEHDER